MIAKIRLITNADEIEKAYEMLDEWNGLLPEERQGRKPKIPKMKVRYAPFQCHCDGIRIACQENDVIQLKHADSGEWLPIKNEPQVWEEISSFLNNKKVKGFGK